MVGHSRSGHAPPAYQPRARLGLAVTVAAGLQAALFAAFLARSTILRPFNDMISWLDAYLQFRRLGGVLHYLWLPHNEHHLLLIRLLTALDVSTMGARGIPFVAAATGALVLTSWLVLAELRRDAALMPPLRALTWLGPMLLLNSAAVADCALPINCVYPLALLFIVATLVLFDGEAERTRQTDARRAGALAMAVLAGLANGVGLVAWPALLWSVWRGGARYKGCGGARRGWLLAIGATGAAYGAVYVGTLPATNHVDPAQMGPAHLAKLANYLLAYLGLPLSRVPGLGVPGRLLGGLLLLAGTLAVALDAASPRPATRLHRIGIGLIVAALAAALLAVVGRADMAADVRAPLRYTVMVAPLHVGLLCVVLPFLARRTPPTGLLSAACGFALLLLTFQVFGGFAVVTATDAIAATLDRYAAGVRAPDMTWVVFPDLSVADRVLSDIKKK